MKDYYRNKLAAERLLECYRIASPRVRQYMDAEIAHAVSKIKPGDTVLDLGCGFGRVMPDLAQKAALVVGIDNSFSSLNLARDTIRTFPRCVLVQANALRLSCKEKSADTVVCIQNGISAFHVDQQELIRECLRVTRPGGIVLFSTYSEKFWDHRLEWFHRQADAGLLGEIDKEQTRNGVIVCKDGFTATTVGPERFLSLTAGLAAKVSLVEVDESSLFCELTP
jgi:ubiquinone/menaquinone biosynthesis C-methylase UbiE